MPRESDLLLKEIGAVLIRKNRHERWQLPNGELITRAVSPSDIRAELNVVREIRRRLEGVPEHRPGSRRERRQRKRRAVKWDIRVDCPDRVGRSLREQLVALTKTDLS